MILKNLLPTFVKNNSSRMRDPCIRQILRETELTKFLHDGNSKVVEEFTLPVAKARVDIAVINGALHAYEIKSAADTLARLPSQIESYLKVFDYISVVTEKKHFERILTILPESVGLIVCDENSDAKSYHIRKPQLNKAKESFYIAKLLWRDELTECLNKFQIPYKTKDRNWLLCENLSNKLDIDSISDIVREKIKLRSNWKE